MLKNAEQLEKQAPTCLAPPPRGAAVKMLPYIERQFLPSVAGRVDRHV